MRHSYDQPLAIENAIRASESNTAFFKKVFESMRLPAPNRFGILLVGGSDHASLVVRKAQSVLRYDAQPSSWSHCALVLRWESPDPRTAGGVEVSLMPEDPLRQVPERNGVTTFRLSRYASKKLYPNLCFITVAGVEEEQRARLEGMEKALLDPNRDRLRYPLWNLLGVWRHHVHAPGATENPLLEGYPVPSAALCEYAFEAGDIDITAGATSPNTCPETIWTTLRHWRERISETDLNLQGWKIERVKGAGVRETLPYEIDIYGELSRRRPARRGK
jgi:hypothetical protein